MGEGSEPGAVFRTSCCHEQRGELPAKPEAESLKPEEFSEPLLPRMV